MVTKTVENVTLLTQVTKKVSQIQRENHSAKTFKAAIKKNKYLWQSCVDYPLALFWNKARSNQFFIVNLAEADDRRVMIQSQLGQFLAFDQVVMSSQTHHAHFSIIACRDEGAEREDSLAAVSLSQIRRNDAYQNKIFSLDLTVLEPFVKGSIFDKGNWRFRDR